MMSKPRFEWKERKLTDILTLEIRFDELVDGTFDARTTGGNVHHG